MEPELEKLLERIKPDSIITSAEAKYLKKLKKMQSQDSMLYMKYLTKYYDAKLCRNKKE